MIGIFLLIFGGGLLAMLTSCVFVVRGKTAAILETFGQPHEQAAKPGLNFKMPYPMTKVVAMVNLQIHEVAEDVSVKTSDNAFMVLPVKVQYRASDDPAGAVKAYYELENPERQITSYILNNVRQTAAGMEMIELYKNRDKVENEVHATLADRFSRFGFIIENVLVDEPQPSQEVRNAFNKVIASKREMEAAENLAAAERIKLVGIAEAEAASKRLQGRGIADMREAIGKGLKDSIKLITDSGLSTEQALLLINETNRLDTLNSAASKGNLVILDLSKNGSDVGSLVAATRAMSQHAGDRL